MRLPSVPGGCWSIGLGLDVSLPMVCAASVPRAVDQLLTAAPTCGGECTAGGVEPRVGGRASDGVTTWLPGGCGGGSCPRPPGEPLCPIRAQEVPHRSSADDALPGQRIPTAHAAVSVPQLCVAGSNPAGGTTTHQTKPALTSTNIGHSGSCVLPLSVVIRPRLPPFAKPSRNGERAGNPVDRPFRPRRAASPLVVSNPDPWSDRPSRQTGCGGRRAVPCRCWLVRRCVEGRGAFPLPDHR